MSVQPPEAPRKFELTRAQLAGQKDEKHDFHGLSAYSAAVEPAYKATQISIDASGTQARCHALVIGALALVAAGGAGALIYFSHGPSNLPYFVPGVVLGTMFVGFTVWTVVNFIRAARRKDELKKDLNDQANQRVTLRDMLADMVQVATTRAQIESVMGQLKEARRGQFIEAVSGELFGPDKPELDDGQKKVITAFAAFPETLINQINTKDRAFALAILKSSDAAVLAEQIFAALFAKIEAPENDAEGRLLASHPEALTRYRNTLEDAQKRTYDFAVLEHADPDQDPVLNALMAAPRSEDEAACLLRHGGAVSGKTAADRAFALELLHHASSDHAGISPVLTQLGKVTTAEEAELVARHPQSVAAQGVQGPGYFLAILNFRDLDEAVQTIDPAARDNLGVKDALSASPLAVARLARKDPARFTPEIIGEIFQTMGRAQKIEFLKQMTDALQALKSAEGDTQAEQQPIINAVHPLIHGLITRELMAEVRERPSQELTNLLVQIGRWTEKAAERIFVADFGTAQSFINDLVFMSVLYECMTPEAKDAFVNDAVQAISKHQNAPQVYRWLIESLAQANATWSEPLITIMANTPLVMAGAMHGLTNGAAEKGNVIVTRMKESQHNAYTQHYMEVFVRRVGLEKASANLTSGLRRLQQSPAAIKGSYEAAFFRAFHGQFRDLVLKNEALGSERERGTLALNLLEHMGEKAETVISIMDEGSKGYPYYNYLTNMLVDEAQGKAPEAQTETRARLMACFAFAPDGKNLRIVTTRDKIVFRGTEWKLKPNSAIWSNFLVAAGTQSNNVWKTQ